MAIVANDSITVSNVNDGTITHTAWSYSADGTDRFTTVYPNLNLLNFNSGVTLGKYYGWEANVTTSSGTRAYFKKVKVTPNNQYTISANWSNTQWLNVYGFTNENDTTAVARYGSGGGRGTGSWESNFVGYYMAGNNMTFTVPANVNYIGVSYSSISTNTLTLQALLNGKPKLELGSTVTPWMPSSSEVKTSYYPSYIGTYSDTNINGSTDPSKYTWAVFKGVDGIAGQPGANAPTITNVQDQIYLSTSNTVQSGGSWGTLIPAWSSGKYYWSRVATTFSNGMTTYSIPVLDEALNQVATNQIKVTQLTQDLDGFKTTVSNTYLSKSDASGTYADKVSVTSQINQSATQVTQNIQSWTNGQLSSYSTIQSTDSSIASAVADKADKSQVTQLSDSINLKVSKGDVVSQINVEAGQILFNSNKLVLNANTTEITGDAFIRGDMIVDGSINAEKIVTNNLSAISSSLGDVKAGTYTSWSSETVNGILYLNGIYLYNGRIRSLNIQAPSSIDPDIKNQISGKNCRGTEVYSGDTHLFDSVIPQLSTASPNDILKGNEFWDKTSIFTYCGKISGYRTNGTPHTKYSSQHHIFEGTLQAKSISGNVGGIVLSQGSFPVNVTPNNALKTEWGNEFSSLKLYGQVVGRRQFTLEINMDYVQELPNPDIGYRPYTASAIIGSLGEGVNNREWMVVAGINAKRNDLLFRTYYRDVNGNWNENSSASSYIYLIIPMIY